MPPIAGLVTHFSAYSRLVRQGPEWEASSDAAWKHIDELKRLGQKYLDRRTAHHYPKIYSLPLAHFKTVREPMVIAGKRAHRCGAEARVETNFYGAKGGSASFDEVVCGRTPRTRRRPCLHESGEAAFPKGSGGSQLGIKSPVAPMPAFRTRLDDCPIPPVRGQAMRRIWGTLPTNKLWG